MTLEIVRSIEDIRQRVQEAKAKGKKTCLVPTMGGLHEGHLSLVKKAAEVADLVVVSIFVNPTQFNNPDDFENYPGNEKDDLDALSETATDLVFAPSASEMYPDGFATKVIVTAAENILCDAHRPGHFDGVATIVAKLFLQCPAHYACFGEKDFQQLFIIRQLVRDLNIPIEIVPVETVRETDELALSSRNKRLTKEERKIAPILNQQMQLAAEKIRDGEAITSACNLAIKELNKAGQFKCEYFEIRSADNLQILEEYKKPARMFVAAWLGDVRLIDNIEV